jgi:hypothetical protein
VVNINTFEKYYTETKEEFIQNDTISKEEFLAENTNELNYENLVYNQNNIDDIDAFAEKIKEVLDKSWGSKWGHFGADLDYSENDPNKIQLPQITYDYAYRQYAKPLTKGPTLYKTVKEVVNGKETGDAFNIYRHWYEYMLEFNIWHQNSISARKLMKHFENTYNNSVAYLKEQGLSFSRFISEIPAKDSINYNPEIPASMRCLQYFIRLEKVDILRVSTLESIKTIVSIN